MTPSQVEWLCKCSTMFASALGWPWPNRRTGTGINKTNAPYLIAMEAAGHFQSDLLLALGISNPAPPDES